MRDDSRRALALVRIPLIPGAPIADAVIDQIVNEVPLPLRAPALAQSAHCSG